MRIFCHFSPQKQVFLCTYENLFIRFYGEDAMTEAFFEFSADDAMQSMFTGKDSPAVSGPMGLRGVLCMVPGGG
jgi:hypothetical protein